MKTIESIEEFESFIQNDYVLIDFFASWCSPCRAMTPILEEAETLIPIAKVDIDVEQHEALANSFGVRSIPCLIWFKKGQEVDRRVGAIPATKLTELIEVNAK